MHYTPKRLETAVAEQLDHKDLPDLLVPLALKDLLDQQE